MVLRAPSEVGGYVLAGGKSSRMGRDKALLVLAGKPLILRAVQKLQRVCKEVHVLSASSQLGLYAPLVQDRIEGCGPLGGIDAGLGHSHFDWSLFIPVDMPFFPSAFLEYWIRKVVLARQESGARIALFSVEGVPQPAMCLLHREVVPYVREAVEAGRYKLFPVLEGAGRDLAARDGFDLERVLLNRSWSDMSSFSTASGVAEEEAGLKLTEAQRAAKRLWFANLNTPEDFAEAEKHLSALDP